MVEVRAGTHTLADLDSSNKTRLGKVSLMDDLTTPSIDSCHRIFK